MKKIYFLLLISILTLPFFAFGDVYEYTPLVTIPGSGVEANQPVNLGAYLNGIYRILIAITIILAVIVITISGIQHMASESPFSKSEASKRIGGAIGGIVLAVMSWLILFTINPCLVSFNFLTPTAACGGPNKPNTNNPSTGSGSTPQPLSATFPDFGLQKNITSMSNNLNNITFGGVKPYTFNFSGLPNGITVNSSGFLSGVATEEGEFNAVFTVTDSKGESVSQTVQINVTDVTSVIIEGGSSISKNTFTDQGFNYSPKVSDGVEPFVFQSFGSIPPGLTFNSGNGSFSGVPISIGIFNFGVKVTDSRPLVGGTFQSNEFDQNIQLTVSPLPDSIKNEQHCFLANSKISGETVEVCGENLASCQQKRENNMEGLDNVGLCKHQP